MSPSTNLSDISKGCSSFVSLTNGKKRSEEYDALDLMMKVIEGYEVPVMAIPHRPSPGEIFVFSSDGNQNKSRKYNAFRHIFINCMQ